MSERKPDLNMLAVLIESTFASPNNNDDMDRAISLGAILLNQDQRSAIVRACNSHDALVKALEPFAEPHAMGDNYVQFAPRLIEAARAALSLARSGK